MLSILAVAVAFHAPARAIHGPRHAPHRMAAPDWQKPSVWEKDAGKDSPGNLLAADRPMSLDGLTPLVPGAYTLAGIATSAAWATCVRSAITSTTIVKVPVLHGRLAMTSSLAPLPLIWACFAVLASASKVSFTELKSVTYRRLNLGLVAACIGSCLAVYFAPAATALPGSGLSHVVYAAPLRGALLGAFGSAAALCSTVWLSTIPAEVPSSLFAWLGRVADGVAGSLVRLAPSAASDDPDNSLCVDGRVKYAVLSAAFLVMTFLGVGPQPLATVPSFTGRRLSRAFAAWTLLAAVVSYTLKDAAERGLLIASGGAECFRTLARGLGGFGALYVAANFGKLLFDVGRNGFGHYPAVTAVGAWSVGAVVAIGLTLRQDKFD